MYAKKLFRKLQLKRIISSFLILAMCLTMVPMYSPMAYAKTDTSDAVSQIFVYAADSAKKDVLLKVIPIGDLDAIKHGDLEAKRNYYASFIDSFPTPNYVEGQGITIPELVEYVKNKTMVDKAASLNYTGSDKCYFYTTDGGIRNYTYDKMYGVTRSYYPGIYANWDAENGGIGNVDAVLGSAIAQPAYLALEQGGGRALIDLKEDVQANGNVVDGCMASKLATNESLRLVVPQTEADIKDGKQNFADSLKWINRIKLQPVASPIVSLGTVAAPTCIYELNGTTMTITLSCATEGASIYHSYDGTTMTTTAQNLYTEPIIINNYDSSKPFTLKYQAVKEGWDNVEVQSASSTNHTVADNSPNFNFALTNELTTVVNGGNYTINATLTSDKDFILYGAEFQVKVPNEFFTVGIPTANTGWQVAKATVDTNTVVTFTYLNQSGVAQTANTALALGNIPLTAIQAGNANLAIGNSIVTKSDATAYSKITAATLPITINEKSSNPLAIAVDSNITGGTVTTDSTALLGSIVNVQIQPATGQQLKADTLKYTADGGETYIAIEAKNGVYSFAMPASEVLITAKFETIPLEQAITVQANLVGGLITATPANAKLGTKITLVVQADAGKKLKAGSLKYTTDEGLTYHPITETEGIYSFIMPKKAVNIVAEFMDLAQAITVDPTISNGTVAVNPTSASTGETVAVTVMPAANMQLKSGSLKFIKDDNTSTVISKNNGIYSFLMPKGAVTVTAQFEAIAGSSVDTTWYTANPNANGFSIETAAQLAGLALLVNDGTENFAGKTVSLAGDIDLQGNETNQWTPIGTVIAQPNADGSCGVADASKVFRGTFNGGDHKISGLYINNDKAGQGLFACARGYIGQLTVEGSITTTTSGDFIGGVVAFNNGSTLQNLFSQVKIVARNAKYVGGIAGFSNGSLYNCVNEGAISGSEKVGGLVGEISSGIVQSINKGNIVASKTNGLANVGGLAGYCGNPLRDIIIDNCYNTGSVGGAGLSAVGGLLGFQAEACTKNSYNIGAVTGADQYGAIVGHNESTINENNYSLNTMTSSGAKIDNGIPKTAEELKAIDKFLGYFVADDAAKPINDGYPVLAWQVKATIYRLSSEPYNVFQFKQQYVTEGTIVVANIVPRPGYELVPGSVYLQDYNNQGPTEPIKEDGNVITFVMPNKNQSVHGKFVKASKSVTVQPGISGGNITVSPNTGQQWSTIVVNVVPDPDMRLRAGSLRFKNLNNGIYTPIEMQKDGNYSFYMPTSSVLVEGVFESTSAIANTINTDATMEGGTFTTNVATATVNTDIVVTVNPGVKRQLKEGSLKYTTDGGRTYTTISKTGNVYTFIMPDQAVTLTAEFTKVAGTIATNPTITGGMITTNPLSAIVGEKINVIVKSAEGNELKPGSLKYTIDKGANYIPITKDESGYSFLMPSGDVVIDAIFEATTDGADIAWYRAGAKSFTIKTAAQLMGLANLVNNGITDFAGTTITLGKDINLNGSETNQWTTIGTAISKDKIHTDVYNQVTSGIATDSLDFAGTFDGGNYTISGLFVNSSKPGQGLFAYNTGTIKNLTVEGSITSTFQESKPTDLIQVSSDYVGGITGFNQGTIADVTSKVVVQANNVNNVGGIAGFNDQGTIIRCSNQAAVTGLKKAGGIAGENAGIVRYSYNTGRVVGTDTDSKNGVGGIAGRNGNNYISIEAGLIDGCYNAGTVGSDGQRWVGGIAGFENGKSAVTNSYNVGNVIEGYKDYSGIVGLKESSLNRNNYSLNTTQNYGRQTDPGILKTAADLKAGASLMAAFVADNSAKPLNNGYPVLYWQAGGVEPSTIAIDSNIAGGTIIADASAALKDSVVSVTAKAAADQQLKAGSLKYIADGKEYPITTTTARQDVYSFVMPNSAITITGEFSSAQALTVDAAITGGQVTVKPIAAAAGNPVIVIVKADTGKQLKAGSLRYTTDGGTSYTVITEKEGIYSFTMPNAPVTVLAEFEKAPLAVNVATDIANGQVTANTAETTMDTIITVTVKANADKQLKPDSLKYTADGGTTYTPISKVNDVYSFTMPNKPVMIVAEFEDLALSNINITAQPTTKNYIENQVFDPKGMVVEATYSDGSVKDITKEISYDKSSLATGTSSIIINYIYNGVPKAVIQPITVAAKTLNSLAISKAPNKIKYLNGEIFDKTGMEVTATFNDGTAVLKAADYTVTPNPLTTGSAMATIGYTYKGVTKSAVQAITVAPGRYVEPTVSGKTSNANIDTVNVTAGQPATVEAISGDAKVNAEEITLSQQAVAGLAKASEVSVFTDLMQIEFDKISLDALAALAGQNQIKLNIETIMTSTNPSVNKLINAGYAVYDINLLVNGKSAAYTTKGTVQVTVPYTLKATDGANGENLRIYYINDAGKADQMPCTYANGFISFNVNHFSLYGIGNTKSYVTSGGGSSSGSSGSGSGITTIKAQEPSITIDGKNGKGTLSTDGTSLTIKANNGYLIKDVTLNGVSKGAVTSLSGLKTADKVIITFVKDNDAKVDKAQFSDVPANSWFFDAVQFAVQKGLFTGITDTVFEPAGNMTRGMLVTVLYRLDGQKTASSKAAFADVAVDAYYGNAVAWAAENAIVQGYSKTQFAPNKNINREQMIAILYRYAEYKKYDITLKGDLNSFTDAGKISVYSKDSLIWANANHLITGRTATTLVPQGDVTRAEAAMILQHFVQNFIK